MKQWGWLILWMGCISVSSAADTFTFVSTLSTPVTSFREVETVHCTVATQPQGQFNVGSEAATGGSIVINSGASPMQVNTLQMEDKTQITSSENVKWLVDTLNIGANGLVKVQNLIAKIVSLADGPSATLQLGCSLIIEENAYMKTGKVNKELTVKRNSEKSDDFFWFKHTDGEPPLGTTATWDTSLFVNGDNEETKECYPIHSN